MFERPHGTRECVECSAVTVPEEERPGGKAWPWQNLPAGVIPAPEDTKTEAERFGRTDEPTFLDRVLPWRGPG